jgi:uncharacterized membrane protein
MRMQEPEQWEQPGQQLHSGQEYSDGYRANRVDYAEDYETDQEQKIYPQTSRWLSGTALAIFAIIFSSIGFFLTVAGIVASAIVLQYGHAVQAVLVGGIIGLLSSIGAMLMCIAIFVFAVVTLALRARRYHRTRINHP